MTIKMLGFLVMLGTCTVTACKTTSPAANSDVMIIGGTPTSDEPAVVAIQSNGNTIYAGEASVFDPSNPQTYFVETLMSAGQKLFDDAGRGATLKP